MKIETDLPNKIRKILNSREREAINNSGFRESAVLVILYPIEGNFFLILTKRNNKLRKHAGEISFPGGRFESSLDKNKIETALRESKEEINADIKNIEILGMMDDFATLTGFIITPVIGLAKTEFNFIKQDAEVDKIFLIPIEFFLDKNNFEERFMEIENQQFPISVFNYYDSDNKRNTIWGATAHILTEFIELFLGKKLNSLDRPRYPRETLKKLLDQKKQRRIREKNLRKEIGDKKQKNPKID